MLICNCVRDVCVMLQILSPTNFFKLRGMYGAVGKNRSTFDLFLHTIPYRISKRFYKITLRLLLVGLLLLVASVLIPIVFPYKFLPYYPCRSGF